MSASSDRARELRELIAAADREKLERLIGSMLASEAAEAVSHLLRREQRQLLSLLKPARAADVVEELPEEHAAEVVAELPTETATEIVGQMESDEGADLLKELEPEKREEILSRLPADERREARELIAYPEQTAGAIMMTEFISVGRSEKLGDILARLRDRAREFASYRVSYIYVLDEGERLLGVLPLRDLLLRPADATAGEVMATDVRSVRATTDQEEVAQIFERYHFLAMPVVEDGGRMVGIVVAQDVMKVIEQEGSEDLLKFSGIVSGEETRDMPIRRRAGRRLAWLSVNIFLNLIAASVIWMHEKTLEAAIGIAMFLPIISDMSGCSGNQAVAVSIRELAVGRISPGQFLRVWRGEASVGVLIGLVLGLQLGLIAAFWKQSLAIGAIVGGALWLNTLLSVSVGGMVPLALKGLGKDPALASSPILTTLTDLCGFFVVLSLARMFLVGP